MAQGIIQPPVPYARRQYDLSRGLIGAWPMNEGSGLITHDATGNGLTGTFTGGTKPSWTSGSFGNAILFGGNPAYLSIPNSTLLNPSLAITMCCWVYWIASTETYNNILNKEDSSNFWSFYIKSNGKLATYVTFNGSAQSLDGTGANTVLTNVWTHIGATWYKPNSGTSNTVVSMYFNGKLDATNSGGITGSITTGNHVMTIGGNSPFGLGRWFNGAIRDARVYNRALSATEMKLIAMGWA